MHSSQDDIYVIRKRLVKAKKWSPSDCATQNGKKVKIKGKKGDWLVMLPDGDQVVMSQAQFSTTYEPHGNDTQKEDILFEVEGMPEVSSSDPDDEGTAEPDKLIVSGSNIAVIDPSGFISELDITLPVKIKITQGE